MKTPQVTELLTRHDGLATRLRATRKAAMKAKDLAAAAGWLPSKVSRIESGQQLPSPDDLRAWAQRTGAGTDVLDQWLAMLIEAEELRNSFDRRYRHGQAEEQDKYNRLIEIHSRIRVFEKEWIPRVLQTPAYTTAVVTWTHQVFGGANDIDQTVGVRQSSVRHLYEPHRRFEFLLHESLLLSAWPSPAVMGPQLDRLLTVADLPNVRFGILPVTGSPERPTPASFTLYGDIGYAENPVDDVSYELQEHASILHKTFDSIWPAAAEGDQAHRIIHEAQARLRR